MQRLTILTGDLNFPVRKGIAQLLETLPHATIQVVIHKPKKNLKTLFRNQIINFRKNGWRWIPYQTTDIINRFLATSQAYSSNHERPGTQYDEITLRSEERLIFLDTNDLHSQSTLETVRSFSPELGIALAAPILKESIFSIPKNGTINLHKGMVPHYRGMPPGFWELWNQEKKVGCTIHKVNSKLDCGDILLQEQIPVRKFSTLRGIQLTLDELGIRLTCKAVKQITDNTHTYTKQSGKGTTYRKPTLKQYSELNKRYCITQTDTFLRKAIKSTLQLFYTNIYIALRNMVSINNSNYEICVLLYHRVNDDLRDSVTVGIEQFERHMIYIAKHYHILSIDEIMNGAIPHKNNKKPYLAVTFDDGYLDNYENAVPILLKHKIPAAFFVSTGMIGEQRGFQHDLDKLGTALPNMTWDNLQEMKDYGFTIGSHTVSHINCASANIESVKDELIESKRTIEAKLGQKEVIFAYPFGGRTDINETVVKLVQEIGYIGCLSAYGGTNDKYYDRYNLLRKGIDFNFSQLSFISKIHGW
ncbi:MAG: polysaccharide deacetylase family protein [Sedimenticola sp.]|nr:polysaccharide deacetylase family protein [Sedimenticola sp.]